MEGFRRVIKRRLSILVGLNLLAAVFIALTGEYSRLMINSNENITDMIHGFQVGIFIGIQIIMLIQITRYGKAIKDEDKLRKLYIEENDERTKLIKDKIGGVGFNFALGAIATATVISGFFNQLVFGTLLGVLILITLIKGTLKIYYRNKF